MEDDAASAAAQAVSARPLRWLRLSHSHSAFSATLLLMSSTILSRIIGMVRDMVIAKLYGVSGQADAYRAAFQLPDMINYFMVGGVASIPFVTILSRYREQGREREGEDALGSILTMMLMVLGAGVLVAGIFARSYVAWWFNGFSPEKIALTVHMTRILLPVQLFFFTGGVLGAVLLVRKQFMYQAITPILYNLGIIFGGVVFARTCGVSGLAIGALIGVIAGPFLLNLFGVRRVGFRLRLSLHWLHPGLIEWVRLSLPLMLGVSLVTFDIWIINHFASHGVGDIARFYNAKQLFTAPTAILGMSVGAASMPFFASLIQGGRRDEFARTVNTTISRIVAVSLLGSAWMMGLALPLANLVFRHGALKAVDAALIALYLSGFAISLLCWSAQTIYGRAFYAAGNTMTPMVAGTIIVLASLPLYGWLYRTHGAMGLVAASNLGILAHTLALAILLNRSGLVPLRGLEWRELLRALVAALASRAALLGLGHVMRTPVGILSNAVALLAGTALWLAVCWLALKLTGSQLPQTLLNLRHKKQSAPA
jgi:putative peptidoglycan lipid II flippase